MKIYWIKLLLGVVLALSISACASNQVDKGAPQAVGADGSFIIDALQARKSVLPAQSSYGKLARAVMQSNQNAAEAELRAARLRREAASKNWLPSIGPVISLDTLGALAASIVVEQVIFDNGRKKAQRAFAKADVEVAAVSLAEDSNQRVFEALGLYIDGEEASETASVSQRAHKDMARFRWIMAQRVEGGVSDLSDLNIIDHKLAEIDAELRESQERRSAARGELRAMTLQPLENLRGLTPLGNPGGQKPLAVLRAEAEKERSIASAKIERAGQLPGVKLGGSIDKDGNTAGALRVESDKLLNLGTGAALRAADAAQQAAHLRIARAQEDSNRRIASLKSNYNALRRQSKEAARLATQAKANLNMFQEQYEAGQRQVMDVVGVYETYARQETASVRKKYQAARAALEIAHAFGVLVSGNEM